MEIHGRVSSLLEVGTGFHPELSGRENVYLNGTILGMTKREIDRKFDEIVDFSGVEKFLDTPIKRYSSGMKVRLAFAVAAHLEPEILIIDEVLAVGDAEFQKKCIGKMQDVASGGRTVLFVSHNLGAISQLCSKALLLIEGTKKEEGHVERCLSAYFETSANAEIDLNIDECIDSSLESARISRCAGHPTTSFNAVDDICVTITSQIKNANPNLELSLRIVRNDGTIVFTTNRNDNVSRALKGGVVRDEIVIPGSFLAPGGYAITIGYHYPNESVIKVYDSILSFQIEETGTKFTKYHGANYGIVFCNCRWTEMVICED